MTTESTGNGCLTGAVRTQPDIMEAGPGRSRDLSDFPGSGKAIKAGAASGRQEFPKDSSSPTDRDLQGV